MMDARPDYLIGCWNYEDVDKIFEDGVSME